MVPELIVCDQMDSGWSGTRHNFQSAAIVPLRGAKANVKTNTCEHSEGRTKVRFILPSHLTSPNPRQTTPIYDCLLVPIRKKSMSALHIKCAADCTNEGLEPYANAFKSNRSNDRRHARHRSFGGRPMRRSDAFRSAAGACRIAKRPIFEALEFLSVVQSTMAFGGVRLALRK